MPLLLFLLYCSELNTQLGKMNANREWNTRIFEGKFKQSAEQKLLFLEQTSWILCSDQGLIKIYKIKREEVVKTVVWELKTALFCSAPLILPVMAKTTACKKNVISSTHTDSLLAATSGEVIHLLIWESFFVNLISLFFSSILICFRADFPECNLCSNTESDRRKTAPTQCDSKSCFLSNYFIVLLTFIMWIWVTWPSGCISGIVRTQWPDFLSDYFFIDWLCWPIRRGMCCFTYSSHSLCWKVFSFHISCWWLIASVCCWAETFLPTETQTQSFLTLDKRHNLQTTRNISLRQQCPSTLTRVSLDLAHLMFDQPWVAYAAAPEIAAELRSHSFVT